MRFMTKSRKLLPAKIKGYTVMHSGAARVLWLFVSSSITNKKCAKMANRKKPLVLLGKIALDSAMWPFNTRVKHSFWYSVGLPKCTVRVISVVPSL